MKHRITLQEARLLAHRTMEDAERGRLHETFGHPKTHYQLVWHWTSWTWPRLKRLKRKDTDLALIYRWVLVVGPLEVRRWVTKAQGENPREKSQRGKSQRKKSQRKKGLRP